MGNSSCIMPPLGFSWEGLTNFFFLLIPSTTTLPFFLSIKSTFPRLPLSTPAVTTILSFFFILVVIIYITNVFLGSESENVAREIGRMIFDPNYVASPIPKNIYELVHEFMRKNPSENAERLPAFLKKEQNKEFSDHKIFNQLGYSRLKKEDTPDWALALFKLNVKLFPEDSNLWDSLGEAYLKYGQNEEAIKCYTKAVELGNAGSKSVLDELLEKD